MANVKWRGAIFVAVLLVYTTISEGRPQEQSPPVKEHDSESRAVITELHVRSDIQFRYARTVVESYVKNPDKGAKNVTFQLTLPNTAFVSNFSMFVKVNRPCNSTQLQPA